MFSMEIDSLPLKFSAAKRHAATRSHQSHCRSGLSIGKATESEFSAILREPCVRCNYVYAIIYCPNRLAYN